VGGAVRTVCHLVTISNDPTRGGVQELTDRVAARLATVDGLQIVVYTMSAALSGPDPKPYAVEDLSGERARLSAPLPGRAGRTSPPRLTQLSPEDFQVNRLLLLARLQEAILHRPHDRHVVVSFFLTTLGFTAQLVAQELGIPHVTFVAGSDLNRDVATPSWLAAAAFVVEHADWIMVSNRDQAARLARLFRRTDRISVSHGALPPGHPQGYWQRRARDHVGLVSDCGYSFKKSTHSLVEAFGRLRRDGHPVKLAIVGTTHPEQAEYWEGARRAWRERFGEDATFGGYLPKSEVEEVLLDGDVYCSASLGEGSSNGSLLALALGMPIVAVRSSSLSDLEDPTRDRVGLFRGGDVEDLYRRLVEMVERVRSGLGPADRARIDALRRQLDRTEISDWLGVIEKVSRRP
jgi:glycosyltransferase involved in cell wall biosynthesis